MAATNAVSDNKVSTLGVNTEFIVGETALCYEPDLTKAKMLYEAKILEIDVTKDEKGKKVPEFFIHFMGWNKSWDRWVLSESVMKLSESNKALQTKLYNQAVRSKKKRKSRVEKHDSNEEFDSNSHTSHSSVNSSQAENEDSRDLPVVTISIPNVLKTRLEDDCYYIKRKKKLLKLPRVPNALKILNDFWDYCQENVKSQNDAGNQNQTSINLNIIKEIVCGLQTYLNFTISTLLLYNFEREQFDALFPGRHQNSETEQVKPFAQKKPDESVNNDRSIPSDNAKLSPPPKRKYTRRKYQTPGYQDKKPNSASASAGIIKGTPVSTPNIVSPGMEEVPLRRKRGRPRRARPLENEDANSKIEAVPNEAHVETVDSTHCEKEVEASNENTGMVEQIKPENSDATAVEPEELQPEVKVENEIEKPEQKEDETEVGARSLRPRKSLIPVRLLDEKEAVKEQASLPVGATAQTMERSENAGKKEETLSATNEKADSQDSCFVPYPQSSDQSLSPAEIYGAEHLLRLFVKLPALLARTDLDQRKIELLVEYLEKFLCFMAERAHIWFSPDNYSESVI